MEEVTCAYCGNLFLREKGYRKYCMDAECRIKRRRDYGRRRYSVNKGKFSENARRYREKNRDKMRAYSVKNKAKRDMAFMEVFEDDKEFLDFLWETEKYR